MRRTSSRRSIRLHPSQNRRCTVVTEKFQNQNVQIFGYFHQSTNGPNHGPVWKIQSFLLNEICTVILLAGLSWETPFEKYLFKNGWGKVPNWECLFVNRKKGLFLSVYVDDFKTGWKETKYQSDVEDTHERRWFGRTDIIPWPCLFGLYSTRMSNKQGYCRPLQKYVRIQDFCWSWGKPTSFRENGCEYLLMVLWHGRSCKEMRGKILRTGKQKQLNS